MWTINTTRRKAYLIAGLIMTGYLAIILCAVAAFAHEGHGLTNPAYKAQGVMKPGEALPGYLYLHGQNRDRDADTFGQVVNCCKYGGNGDCTLVQVQNVKIVAGGYEIEGEFIPEAETTASPDDNFYRCKHSYSKTSHCFFAPPNGT